MKRQTDHMFNLYATAAAVIIMAALIPVSPSLACQAGESGHAHRHFLFVFAHAGVLHWAANSWALLVLHNTFRWYRLAAAYATAVTLSFVPCSAQPVLGASALTTFFFGFATPYFWRTDRTAVAMMAPLLLAGCFLPGIAAAFHIVPFVCGFLFYAAERTVRSFAAFIR